MLAAVLAVGLPVHADDLDPRRPAPGEPLAKCPDERPERALATSTGSAGIMKNLAETPDSIRVVAVNMLESALDRDNPQTDPTCLLNCDREISEEVVYRVSPIEFLADEEQNAVCVDFERQTSVDPMRFPTRSFESVNALNEWIVAFSQGRGDDGKQLYEQCSSNCSPRYTFLIAQKDAAYQVRTEVLCGLARDKANDQYLISTALRRTCAVN